MNGPPDKPDITKAGIRAVAPGRQTTLYPFLMALLTNIKPGSLITGVPRSLTMAMFFPCFKYSNKTLVFILSNDIDVEFEETLILSPTTMNKSFPIILCDEDDIQGEHGSTIGKLGSDLLFYMQTRGICKEAAEKIMARARVQAVMDTIPDEETKTLINSYLNKNEEE